MKTTKKPTHSVKPADLLEELLPTNTTSHFNIDAILDRPTVNSIDWVLAWAVASAHTTIQAKENIEYAMGQLKQAQEKLLQFNAGVDGPLEIANDQPRDESICHTDIRSIFGSKQGAAE